MITSIALMRCVHVLTGSIWAGAAILIALYILPAAQATSGGITPEHKEMVRRLTVRLLWATRAVAILVSVATAAMGVARYLV
jgi:uncharacterized membrane protein